MPFTETLSLSSNTYTSHITTKLNETSQPPTSSELNTWREHLLSFDLRQGPVMAQQAMEALSIESLTYALHQPKQPENRAYLAEQAQALKVTGNAINFLIPPIEPSVQKISRASDAIHKVASAPETAPIDLRTWEAAIDTAEALQSIWLPGYTYPTETFQAKVEGHLGNRSLYIENRLALASLTLMPSALNPTDLHLNAMATTSASFTKNVPSDILAERFTR